MLVDYAGRKLIKIIFMIFPLICFLFVSKKHTVSDGHKYTRNKICAAWFPIEQQGEIMQTEIKVWIWVPFSPPWGKAELEEVGKSLPK